ncbi:NACHT domain-containing protein [Planosporangium sp. 12N6]|uniref:NACHT domain-containing protein n=1 Tax=Planosporangium spinosum TaxID=3402278 RepID=UPI003CE8970F
MRTRRLTYADAVQILDSKQSPIATMIGRVAAAVATGGTLVTAGALDFFASRDEFVKWGRHVGADLGDRIRGLRRFDRTERLTAAHAVLVVTSFFETFDEYLERRSPNVLRMLNLNQTEQVAITAGEWPGESYTKMVAALVDSELPMPTSYRPFETVCAELQTDYANLLHRTVAFVNELQPVDDDLRPVARWSPGLPSAIHEDVPPAAVRRYVDGYRALMAQVPEFAMWAVGIDHGATRDIVRTSIADVLDRLAMLDTGMRGIDALLARLANDTPVKATRAGLAARYRAHLDRQILATSGSPTHVNLPTLEDGYVNPRGRIATAERADLPATETWWRDKPLFDDLQQFIVGWLTSAEAVTTPLIVLGQPGSGKSLLTRILSARLPTADFLAVRVELRNVPADAPVQVQVEEALYQEVGERISWPELVRHAGDALPVIFLDGFDELLQATGMNRADYLEQVQAFQLREAELGRQVAVVLTSRTVVADRARFPHGTAVVRLEPFDERQVHTWLGVWNRANEAGLAARGLRPLDAVTVLRHREIATQPLLLLLLALYDAGDNALQCAGTGLGRVELYERLFDDFAGREVDKHALWQSVQQRRAAMDAELRRLSAAAVAMLNRAGDVITEAELDLDLPHLLRPGDFTVASSGGPSRALTAGQLLVGRFFFIHESRAVRDTGDPEKSFEFLHATFGEFLAAQAFVDALVDLAAEREHQLRRDQLSYDAGYFYAIASFVTVMRRTPVQDFCQGLLARLPADERNRCRDLVLDLLPKAAFPQTTWSHQEYQPHRRPFAARQATFTATLVWFAVALSNGPVNAGELVGEPAAAAWRQQALLWHSQLEPEDRQRIWQTFRVSWSDETGDLLQVALEDGSDVSLHRSLPWPPDDPISHVTSARQQNFDLVVPHDTRFGRVLRRSAFVQTSIDAREYLYALAPYVREAGDVSWADEYVGLTDATFLQHLLLGQESSDIARTENLITMMQSQLPPHFKEILLLRAMLEGGGRRAWIFKIFTPSERLDVLGGLSRLIASTTMLAIAAESDGHDDVARKQLQPLLNATTGLQSQLRRQLGQARD